jgi:uncharacterized protein GlcG (DUF336 family)
MPDEPSELRAEVAALREECAALRRDLRALQKELDFHPRQPGAQQKKYMIIDAECVGVRHNEKTIPIILRAHEGTAEITLHDENHRYRGVLGIYKDGVRFEIRNAEGKTVVSLGEAPDGTGMLHVADAAGHPRAGLRVNDAGGVVNVVNEKGKALAALCTGEHGGEIFSVTHSQHAAVTIKSSERGGLVSVFEPGGQLMGFLSASTDMGSVSVYGPHGARAVSMGGGEEGGGLVFYDVEGKPKGRLP